ncbi:hypothetical protein [Billgrantia kenyensis]|uniref:Lipoprotein n=1 Tax=Billgrantia kenyensis TaxID=321266 RepID=A0A7V9W3V1_9GAMM|nr:hypothetical protein [Halomonas kenyensis]MBA2780592.1 hypothetical protein [Halomonas kenyensis]MCG6663285.1 hypothetical protein [Halomonas kenyensis]
MLALPLRSALLCSVAILVSACAAPKQPYWYKEGVSAEDTRSAYAECRYEIGMSDKTQAEGQQLLNYCMERHGFRLRR